MKAQNKKHKSIKICILISCLCLVLSGLLFIVTGILYDSPYNIEKKEVQQNRGSIDRYYGDYNHNTGSFDVVTEDNTYVVTETVEYHKKDFADLPTGIAAIILVVFGILFFIISLIRLIVYKTKTKAPKQQIIINNYYYKQ